MTPVVTGVLAGRMIAGIVALGLACVAGAQETRFVAFAPPTTLVWTNSQTNAYYVVEYTMDLGYEWMPAWDPTINKAVTSSVMCLQVDSNLCQQVVQVCDVAGRTESLFYRVSSSFEPFGPRYVTNEFRVFNAGTSTLSSISLGYQSGSGLRAQQVNPADLVPGDGSDFHSFYGPLYSGGEALATPGLFFHFVQAGSVRDQVVPLIPWGPPQKRVQVVVSNDSYTVRCDWLNLQSTTPWYSTPQ